MAWFRGALGAVAFGLGLAPATVFAQTRVACVGDSITYGYGLGNRDQEAYPSVLADLLGSEFDVGNFGDSGSTLQDDGDKPWRAQGAYSQCLAFEPNVVVIMLGTNDAKPSNWSEAGFVEDYQALITEFRDLGASVYVATPPPVVPPGAFEIQPSVVNEDLVPLVRQIALDAAAPLIDVYAALEDQPDLLPDTVHPNAAGARVIAETVADALLTPDETSTSSSTSTAVTSGTSASAGGSGGAGSASDGLTASATGAGGQGGAAQATTANTSDGPVAASSSVSSTTSTQSSSAQSSSAQSSSAQSTPAAASSSSSAGGAAATGSAAASEGDSGCACSLSRTMPASAASFWGLAPLMLLARRRERGARLGRFTGCF